MRTKETIPLEADYDIEFDNLHLRTKEHHDYEVSIEANSNLIIDVSKDKKIIAFEILDATYFFDMKNTELVKSNFEINVVVTEDIIKLHFDVSFGETLNRNIKVVSSKALNDDQVDEGLYTYAYKAEIELNGIHE